MNRFIDINPERCIGCGTCQSACADAHRMQGLQDTPRLALVKTGGISLPPPLITLLFCHSFSLFFVYSRQENLSLHAVSFSLFHNFNIITINPINVKVFGVNKTAFT